jgi:multidrug resistance protein, MATE family
MLTLINSADFKVALRKTTGMALPLVASYISVNMGAFISMMMIAKLGHTELAAGGLINSVMMSLMVPLWAGFSAIGAVAGHKYGAEQYSEIGRVLRQGLLLAIIIGLPIMILLRHIGAVLIFFGQDHHLAQLTQNYYLANSWNIIPSLWWGCFTQFFISVGRQKNCLLFTALTTALVVAFGYTFTFGHFGMPALGISGMGYAWVFADIVVLLVMVATLLGDRRYQRYHLFDFCRQKGGGCGSGGDSCGCRAQRRINLCYLKEIIKIGWPITAMVAGELTIFAFAIILYGWIGEVALAAQNMALQINVLAFMVPEGIGQAVMVLISQELGAKRYGTIRNFGYAAAVLGFAAACLVIIIYIVAHKYLLGFYLDLAAPSSAATLELGTFLLILFGVINLLDFPRFMMVSSLRGLRDTVKPMLIFIGLGAVVSLPLSYLLAFVMNFGALGMPWGFIIGYLIGAIILLRRFHRLSGQGCLSNVV